MLGHPAERYIRLRIWQGISEDALLTELTHHLRMPEVMLGPKKVSEDIDTILKTSRKRKQLSLVAKGAQVVLNNRAEGLPLWVDVDDVTRLDDKSYVKAFHLDEYMGSRAKVVRFQNAIRIWCTPKVCELIKGLLFTNADDRRIRDKVVAHHPDFRLGSQELRPVDVKSFRELMWDLTGMDEPTRRRFADQSGSLLTAIGAGEDAFLFRKGMGILSVGDLERFRTARDVAYLVIDRMRRVPASWDAHGFSLAYKVMLDATEQVKKFETEARAENEEDLAQMRMQEVEDFRSYEDIMREADLAADLDLLKQVRKHEGISADKYEELLACVEGGQLLDFDARLGLVDWLDEKMGVEHKAPDVDLHKPIISDEFENETAQDLDQEREVPDLDQEQALTLSAMLLGRTVG